MKTRKLFMGLFLFMAAFVVGIGGMLAAMPSFPSYPSFSFARNINYYDGYSTEGKGAFVEKVEIDEPLSGNVSDTTFASALTRPGYVFTGWEVKRTNGEQEALNHTVAGVETNIWQPDEQIVKYADASWHETDAIAQWVKKEYTILEGAEQAYTGKGDLTFRFEGSVAEVDKVFNGKTDITALVELTDGSVYVTLPEDYVSALKPNTYTLKLVYENGNTSETTFVVPAEENPNTGDNIALYTIIGLISTIGLAGAGLYLKKRRFN